MKAPDSIQAIPEVQRTFLSLVRHAAEPNMSKSGDLNHDNNNQFNSSAIAFGSTQLKEIWRVTNSIFTGQIFTMQLTQNQSGSTIGSPGAYKIFANGTNHTLLSCEDLPVESEIQDLSEIEIQEALQVAGDSINYPEYTELSEWYDERQVYEWLLRDSMARATYPLLNAFYANQESLLTDEIRTLDLNMDILCQENTLNDSTIFQYQIQELTQENTALPVGRLFENYEKDLNRIYLGVLSQGWQNLTTADFEQLEELALSCPFVYGSAVYKARSLYAHIQPGISYKDLEICNAVGVYKNGLGSTSNEERLGQEFSVLIYPNPASEQIQIQTSLSDGIINIRVYDMTGQLVQTASLAITNGITELPLKSMNAGMYNLQIELNNQIKYSKFIKL
ncbi:MAG: T9SS type A sorting domain-containing protein [Chitinophagaceae bacterium]